MTLLQVIAAVAVCLVAATFIVGVLFFRAPFGREDEHTGFHYTDREGNDL